MLLRLLQRNLQKRSARYVLLLLFLFATFALLGRDKNRFGRTGTRAVISRIQNYVEDSFDVEPFEDDFDLPRSVEVKPFAHYHHHKKPGKPHGLVSHIFRDDGLLEVNAEGRHPIFDLISRAERNWHEKVKRQSTSLAEAVREYKNKYRRDPPMGFKDWWTFVQANDVQLPDEYDQIYKDLEPFWGMSPSHVQTLQAEYEGEPGTFTLSNGRSGFRHVRVIESSVSSPTELEVMEKRSEMQINVLGNVSQWLPPFRATVNYHDAPRVFVGHDLKSEAVDAAAMQEYIDSSKSWESYRLGWGATCPSSSPLRRDPDASLPPSLDHLHAKRPKTFIYNHIRSMNPCLHHTHIHLNGQLLNFGRGPPPRQRHYPCFSMSSTTMHADILTVSPENWVGDGEIGIDPSWEEKPYDTLYWRGSTTGMSNKASRPWQLSQRMRLVKLANQQDGMYDVLLPIGPNAAVGSATQIQAEEMNNRLMNVSFFGKASQCEPQVCELINNQYLFTPIKESWNEGNKHKYVLDIDGNGWSARFKRLMTTNALVLKATICPEWFSERVMPWVHYVPVKMDLTDLYDIMVFFRGNLNGKKGHDELARKIAMAGKDWSNKYWRQEDHTAYMFRLLLEWARILSPDRDSMAFMFSDEFSDPGGD